MENFSEIVDKRKYARVNSSLPLHYRNLKVAGDPTVESSSRNLSEGGVCFKSSRFISLACRLVLEITLPAQPKPIKAITKVAWIKRIPDSEQYELGNQFLEITREDKARVAEYISKNIG